MPCLIPFPPFGPCLIDWPDQSFHFLSFLAHAPLTLGTYGRFLRAIFLSWVCVTQGPRWADINIVF